MALRLRVANPSDNEQLISLARRCPMHGLLTLYVDRAPDFFFLNRLQGDEWRVYVAEEDGGLSGSISIAYRTVFVQEKPARVVYLSDIKIPPERRGSTVAFRLLRELYEREHSNEFDFFICSVLKGNEAVIDLFKGRAGLPFLTEVSEIIVHNIIALLKRKERKRWEIRAATERDISKLVCLLNEFHTRYNFAPRFSEESFEKMLAESLGCSIRDYVLAEKGGRICAMAARWDQSANKKLVVQEHSVKTRALVGISRLMDALKLAPGLPGEGEPLRVLQIRHLAFTNGCDEALRDILVHLHNEAFSYRFHLLQAALSTGDPLTRLLPASLSVSIPLKLYCGTLAKSSEVEKLKGPLCYEDVCLV